MPSHSSRQRARSDLLHRQQFQAWHPPHRWLLPSQGTRSLLLLDGDDHLELGDVAKTALTSEDWPGPTVRRQSPRMFGNCILQHMKKDCCNWGQCLLVGCTVATASGPTSCIPTVLIFIMSVATAPWRSGSVASQKKRSSRRRRKLANLITATLA